jgi:hypothetical protein
LAHSRVREQRRVGLAWTERERPAFLRHGRQPVQAPRGSVARGPLRCHYRLPGRRQRGELPADERAGSRAAFDEAFGGELVEGLDDGRAGYPESRGQGTRGRQAGTGLELAVQDGGFEALMQSPAQRPAALLGERNHRGGAGRRVA